MTDNSNITNSESDSRQVPPPGPQPDAAWQQARRNAAAPKSISRRPKTPELAFAWVLASWRAQRLPERQVPRQAVMAFAIWLGRPERGVIEGLILAGTPIVEIARVVGHEDLVVWIYEHVFFAVRDRRENEAWIDYYALRRNGCPAVCDDEYMLRYFGYYLGRPGLEIAHSVLFGENLDRHSEVQIRSVTAVIEAMRMPIDPWERLNWLRTRINPHWLPANNPMIGRTLRDFSNMDESLRQYRQRKSEADPIVVSGSGDVVDAAPDGPSRPDSLKTPTRPKRKARSKRKAA